MPWREWIDRVYPPGGWQPMPVQRGEQPEAGPPAATRRDGTTCGAYAGLPDLAGAGPDQDSGVTWTRWPP